MEGPVPAPVNPPPKPLTADALQLLLQRAHQGDLTVLPELRDLLDSRPDLWQDAGNLALHAEVAIAKLRAGPDPYLREAARRKLATVKAELTGPPPTPLERLLVHRLGVCWLQVHHADLDAAQARGADGGLTAQSL